jgi:CheY-like chemotaxis protein
MPETLPSLLLVDDDAVYRDRLGKALSARGYEVRTADIREFYRTGLAIVFTKAVIALFAKTTRFLNPFVAAAKHIFSNHNSVADPELCD